MIIDVQTLLSDDQALTSGAQASTNYLDMGAPGTPVGAAQALTVDHGLGPVLPLMIMVNTTFAGGTSTKAAVQTDDNTSFSSATTVLETEAIALATLVAGYQFVITQIPVKSLERYVRALYTTVGTHTAGKVSAGIIGGHQFNV